MISIWICILLLLALSIIQGWRIDNLGRRVEAAHDRCDLGGRRRDSHERCLAEHEARIGDLEHPGDG